MKPKDWFGIVIRSFGVMTLIGSVLYFFSGVVAVFAPDTPYAAHPLSYFGESMLLLLMSRYLLLGAPRLVQFAYGEVREASSNEPNQNSRAALKRPTRSFANVVSKLRH